MQSFIKYTIFLLGLGVSFAATASLSQQFGSGGATLRHSPSTKAGVPQGGALSSALTLTAPSVAVAPVIAPALDTTTTVTSNPVVKQKAFSNLVNTMMPMSPDQIKALHYYYKQTRNAVAATVGAPPKPTSTSLIVDLSPGATPPVIRMSSGFISTLVILDSTGQPWPIASEDLGDPKDFNIQVDSTGTSLLIQAMSGTQKVANLAVMLKGLSTPVMITLLSGQSSVDYRVDLRVPRMGPNATHQVSNSPNVASKTLLNVLDGIPPQGSHSMQISDPNSQAWTVGGSRLFVRTRMSIISPSWVSSMSSADGTHAYELPKTPMILAMQNGKIVKLTIGDELND